MTMRLAVMADKPSFARVYRDVIADRNPSADLSATPVLYSGIGWIRETKHRFRLPRGLRWSDYPIIQDHVYRELYMWDSAVGLPGSVIGSSFISPDDLVSKFRAANKVIMLIDPDRSNIHPAQLYLRKIFGDNPEVEIHWVDLNFYNKDLDQSYVSQLPPEHLSDCFKRGEIRRFFDYNYIVNSLAIIGETARRAGFYDVVPSKYGLQILLHIDPGKNLSQGEVVDEMTDWKGTGKYAPEAMNYEALGSTCSRSSILEHLIYGDFLEEISKNRYRISEGGKRFISLLHPNCKDADLPFRIEEWSRLPLDEAKDRIGRYLRTFFGRQKRYLEKMS